MYFSLFFSSSYENALDLHAMHATTSYNQITASFDAALLQIDTSSSPGSSSEEPSPIALHSPIRWERKLHQPIKIEVSDGADPVNTGSSSPDEQLKLEPFLLQPVKKNRERPIRKVRSLRKIIEDDNSGSNSDSKLSKSLKELTSPFLVNGDHSLDSELEITKQNFRGSPTAKVSQGIENKYKVFNELTSPLVNGTSYANKPEKHKSERDGTLSPGPKGDNWERSAVKFCISDSSDEEDNNTHSNYIKPEFVLDI